MTLLIDIDLAVDVDWNSEDETGMPRTFSTEAADPSRFIRAPAGRSDEEPLSGAEVADISRDAWFTYARCLARCRQGHRSSAR